ncbi:cytoplasmic protein [Planoprotostelium fungivorum]|uniref:Cytoplasmic protein n=1 Tax=Planoprotostelium fungivorum TaxID=1890364 RepID=A0A2P6NBB6_9EUKA|nr:cytoplasmic protein [Planoprotostelium fungivorum]
MNGQRSSRLESILVPLILGVTVSLFTLVSLPIGFASAASLLLATYIRFSNQQPSTTPVKTNATSTIKSDKINLPQKISPSIVASVPITQPVRVPTVIPPLGEVAAKESEVAPIFKAPLAAPVRKMIVKPIQPTITTTTPPISVTQPSNPSPSFAVPQLPQRSGRSSGAALTGTATMVNSSTVKKRNKVALEPGHSPLDWAKLVNSGRDLSGTGGRMFRINQEELAKHNKKDDLWMVLKGKVYNCTAYLKFHPGGVPELMRGAGKDGSQLFDEYHAWVNPDATLKGCMVGIYVPE